MLERCGQWSYRLVFFRERTSDFSLKYRAIQPSEVFGARRKVVLQGEGNAWAPVSWIFDKVREVRDLSYLGFTLYLSICHISVGLKP